ncbi:unnamed protein product [Vicia faba]|uniref:Helitron helicase-like domain-containing protein n=1 Tax=Vicia faba TaxID=3906 RepID=A0AAV1AK76_VICFA|nr:unnamed protein product [Vicia faba]
MLPNYLENNLTKSSIARHRRRLILKGRRNTRDGLKTHRPTSSKASNSTSFILPSSLTLTSDATTFHNNDPALGNANTLLRTFRHTVKINCNVSQASTSTSTSPTYGQHIAPDIPFEPQYSHDAVPNSEDDLSLANTLDFDADINHESLVDSHMQEYSDIGDQKWECTYCQACMCYQQRAEKLKTPNVPKFLRCCRGEKIVLPLLQEPPKLLQHLLYNRTCPESKNYQNNIQTYTTLFSFTSLGMKFDITYSNTGGPPNLRQHRQTCHGIGTLLSKIGHPPQYAQLYIYDTNNKFDNRMECFRDNKLIQRDIVDKLNIMLDEFNVHAKAFRMARDILKANSFLDLNLWLICDRPEDGRVYNRPTVSEASALIVGDIDSASKRDIIIQPREDGL